ncbi:hypothetical protein ACWD4B_01520 [Streptomyces sp. NPDC002536]
MKTVDLPANTASRNPLSEEQQSQRLRALVAPVARHAHATVTDPGTLQIAYDIADGFAGCSGERRGATKAEVWEWISKNISAAYSYERFEERWRVFESDGLIKPLRLKKHQQRHTFDPYGGLFLIIWDRVNTEGGLDELISLLDRTQHLLDRERPDRQAVLRNITYCQWIFATFAVQLEELVLEGSVQELKDYERQYNHRDLYERVLDLSRQVTRRFPRDFALAQRAVAMVEAELRYGFWATEAVKRVADQAARSLDFDLFSAEDYLDAAKYCPPEALTEVGKYLVADSPPVWVDAGSVVEALEMFVPRWQPHRRPPVPRGTPEQDPLGPLLRRRSSERVRRENAADRLLLEREQVEVTEELRRSRWPQAARLLTDLLMLDADPHAPYGVQIAVELIIDRLGWVTYLHPVTLHRVTVGTTAQALPADSREAGHEEP